MYGHPFGRILTVFIVHIVCQQRGQIPSVGRELERMLREAGNTKILESVYIPTDTSKCAS